MQDALRRASRLFRRPAPLASVERSSCEGGAACRPRAPRRRPRRRRRADARRGCVGSRHAGARPQPSRRRTSSCSGTPPRTSRSRIRIPSSSPTARRSGTSPPRAAQTRARSGGECAGSGSPSARSSRARTAAPSRPRDSHSVARPFNRALLNTIAAEHDDVWRAQIRDARRLFGTKPAAGKLDRPRHPRRRRAGDDGADARGRRGDRLPAARQQPLSRRRPRDAT